jgi:hypothetical protein
MPFVIGLAHRRDKRPTVVYEETMCCGFKKCPVLKLFDDGSIELTDNDPEVGSVGTIRLRREVAQRLSSLLGNITTK